MSNKQTERIAYIRETLIEAQTYCGTAAHSPSMCDQLAHAVSKLDAIAAELQSKDQFGRTPEMTRFQNDLDAGDDE